MESELLCFTDMVCSGRSPTTTTLLAVGNAPEPPVAVE